MNACVLLFCFLSLLFYSSGSTPMKQPCSQGVGLPTTVNVDKKVPHRHTQHANLS